jgi:hypothetical protein
MELRPQDLDAAHRDTLIRLREEAVAAESWRGKNTKRRKKRDNKNFRIFASIFLALFIFHSGNMVLWGHDVLPGSWLILFLAPLLLIKRINQPRLVSGGRAPITLAEAEAIGAGAEALEAGYSVILRSVIETEGLSVDARRNVHEALRDIGDLVTKLSAEPVAGPVNKPLKIHKQASEAEEKASQEADPVVAASLRRQAETLRASAVLAEQLATLKRRREAARGEVLTQIQAMHVSLENHALSGQNESGDFEGLSANIQQIAAEVNATLNAREEVRSVISPHYQEPPTSTQKLGH